MKYIHRTVEKVIKEESEAFSVVALTGPRQAGKSTTLKKIFSDKYQYISLDNPETRSFAIKDPKAFVEGLEDYCIIDEAQYSPDIFSYVKMKVDSNPDIKGRFILSGSQQFLLMKSITESLAGRVSILNMYPLSFGEIKKYNTKITGEECFYSVCMKTGYPEPFLNPKMKTSHWCDSYLQSYVQRDVRALYNIGKLKEFESFIKMLAAQAGQILNLSRFSKSLGVAVNTLKSWVSILEASGLIIVFYPYYSNVSKRLTKNPKIIFVDTGLLCRLAGLETKESLKNSPMYGSIFENYCIMETIKYFYNKGIKKDIYFLRDQTGLEIDILIEANRKLYPVEVKTSGKISRKAAGNIEKFILGYKSLAVEKGYILFPAGKKVKLGEYTLATGLDEYFKILSSIKG